MTTKICTKCLEHKPLDRFSLRKSGEPARRAHCMDCKNKYMAEYKRGAKLENHDIPAKPVDHANVVPPARLNLWERPVYVPEPWGR